MARIDPAFLAEVKARVSLAELIGRTVALRRAGRELTGLCPFHRERRASFYVVEDRHFWHCFGCGAHGDAVTWIMRTMTAHDFREAVEYLAGLAGMRPDSPRLEQKPIDRVAEETARAEHRRQKIAKAREIWARTRPLAGTPAETYLRRARRLGPVPLGPALRFHPSCAHPKWCAGGRPIMTWPALVAGIQDAAGQFCGVQATLLRDDGLAKAPVPPGWPPRWLPAEEEWQPKITRGDLRGAAVRLGPTEALMLLAEGVETGLSLLAAHWDPDLRAFHAEGEPLGVWATLSRSRFGDVVMPDGVRELILAADGDDKMPADPAQPSPEEIVAAAAARQTERGLAVRIARPPQGKDFNDLLPAGAGMEAA